MKSQEILSSSSSRSWVLVFTVLFILLFTSLTINAQSINKKVTFNDEDTNDYIIKSFNVKEVSSTLYFKFLVLENRHNTNYTLESSINGIDFYAVQLKEGFKSPQGIPLLYCYSVNLNELNDKTYRIRRDSPDGVDYSSILQINSIANPNLSAQNN